jgi:hypothetical protein
VGHPCTVQEGRQDMTGGEGMGGAEQGQITVLSDVVSSPCVRGPLLSCCRANWSAGGSEVTSYSDYWTVCMAACCFPFHSIRDSPLELSCGLSCCTPVLCCHAVQPTSLGLAVRFCSNACCLATPTHWTGQKATPGSDFRVTG